MLFHQCIKWNSKLLYEQVLQFKMLFKSIYSKSYLFKIKIVLVNAAERFKQSLEWNNFCFKHFILVAFLEEHSSCIFLSLHRAVKLKQFLVSWLWLQESTAKYCSSQYRCWDAMAMRFIKWFLQPVHWKELILKKCVLIWLLLQNFVKKCSSQWPVQ